MLIFKYVLYAIAVLVLAGIGLWLFGPREPMDGPREFANSDIGADVDAYLATAEAAFDDVQDGAQKRVIWAGAPGAKTAWSVVYLHGFSATSEEIRPVPDRLADGLGANLHFTRFTGHGRSSDAMAEGNVPDWRDDVTEALEIGRRIGERVIVIGTSTGGTMAALAAADPAEMRDVAGIAFVSPNFEVANSAATLLNWPTARQVVPVIVGETRGWEPVSEAQGKWWRTSYPTVAVLPMAAAVKAASSLDLGKITTPALFIFSDEDQVVSPERTRYVAANWGGDVTLMDIMVGPGDDAQSHVIAGDIMSPSQNDPVVEGMLNWARGL